MWQCAMVEKLGGDNREFIFGGSSGTTCSKPPKSVYNSQLKTGKDMKDMMTTNFKEVDYDRDTMARYQDSGI